MTDLSAETAQRSALRADGVPAHLTQGGGHLDRQIFGAGGAIIQKKNKEKEKGKGKEERREKRKKERGEFNLEDPMFPI